MKFLEPEHSGETFWMLLSILTLPPTQQLKIIGGLSADSGSDSDRYYKNNASHFLDMLREYYSGWFDAFYPTCAYGEDIYRRAGEMNHTPSAAEFLEGADWRALRDLAARALKEAGLDKWPHPERLKFSDYIEIVAPEP